MLNLKTDKIGKRANKLIAPNDLVKEAACKNQLVLIVARPLLAGCGLSETLFDMFEQKSFRVIERKMILFTPRMVEKFYHEHIKKPFFPDLLAFMVQGPCGAAIIWKKENAVQDARAIMGDTFNPKPGTARCKFSDFGQDGANAAHCTGHQKQFYSEFKVVMPDGLSADGIALLMQLTNKI